MPLPPDAHVLDLACGNLRFERFMVSEFPGWTPRFTAVDLGGCQTHATEPDVVEYHEVDLVKGLIEGGDVLGFVEDGTADLAVSFGFLHHVPTQPLRTRLMEMMLDKTMPGGYAAVTFWRFGDNGELAARAAESTLRAVEELGICDLDPGDSMLGWRGMPGVWRYCHRFTDAEIGDMIAPLRHRAEVVARFRSDGRDSQMNEYLVLRKSMNHGTKVQMTSSTPDARGAGCTSHVSDSLQRPGASRTGWS